MKARILLVLLLLPASPPARLSAQDLATVRFTVGSAGALDSVRRLGIDVVEIRPRADRQVDLVAVAGPDDRARLAARGWLVSEVPRGPEAAAMETARAARGAAAFTVYRDFDDPTRGVAAWLRAFDAARANVTLDSIGASVLGRPLLAAKIGPPNDDPGRPNVLYLATYHAREWAATEMALRLLTWLADSLPLLPDAGLLATRDVWVLPVVNPDGYQFTFSSQRLWRKNRASNSDGSFGVDLNRNHNAFWGFDEAGSSGAMPSEVYRGTAVSSEPEVRAVEAFHRAHPPVASISYHTYTGAVLYPWGHANGILTGDDAVFRALAGSDDAPPIIDNIPGSINAYYHPGPAWHLYPTNGEYAAYAYRAFRTFAFTVELTSGCCVGGNYYGFEFPDDEALLDRMFRDNLPFAFGLLKAADNITAATVPPGAHLPVPQIESFWPRVRALVNAPSSPSGLLMDVAVDSGIVALRTALRDSLGIGRRYVRVEASDSFLVDARAVRLPSEALVGEVLVRDGAELSATPWTGFAREGPGFGSAMAWRGFGDTLTSPAINVAGRQNLKLYFWTRHYGSIFNQQIRGRVQLSVNGGPWSSIHQLVGAAPEWYPVAVTLPVAPGQSVLRVRFLSDNMDLWVDAVAVAAADASVSRLFNRLSQLPAPAIEVSANPVRAAPLTLRWLPATGTARVDVFSITGSRVNSVSLAPDPGRWVWDLTSADGRPVANGAYYLLLTLSDGSVARRRLLVAR